MWTCGFCRLRSNIVTRGEGVLFFVGEERKIAEYESGCYALFAQTYFN